MAGPVRADQCENPFSKATLAATTKLSGSRIHQTGDNTIAGDFAFSSGWNSPTSISVAGKDQAGTVTFTAGGSPTANPTITLTFGDGTFTTTPQAMCYLVNTSDPSDAIDNTWAISWATTATTLVVTLHGTATASEAYKLYFMVLGM